MANEVDICNGALIKIGAEEINSLEDDKKSARKCKLRYDICRKYVLRSHPWKVIKDRKVIAPLTSSPAFEWENEFILPENLLRLWLVTDEFGRPRRDFEKEGNKIFADYDELFVKYGRDETDANLFDDAMVEAISLYLAYDICYSLTQDKGLVDKQLAIYNITVRSARSIDAQEDFPKTVNANLWRSERRVNRHNPVRQFPFLR